MYKIDECIYRERWDTVKNIEGVYFIPTYDFSMSAPKPSVVVTQGGDFGLEYREEDFFHWHIRTQGHTDKSVSKLDETVLKLFTTNCDNLREECEMLPLGVCDESCIELINKNLNNVKDKLVYCNFKTYSNKENRCKVLEDCKKLDFVNIEQDLSQEDYYKSLSLHKFVICPTGNGIDSYRIWEGLYSNTIPILQNTSFAIRLAKEFPVLIVDDYTELNIELLNSHLSTISFEYKEKLNKNYWIDKIKRTAIGSL